MLDYQKIDWSMLRKQKLSLLEVIGELEFDLRYDTLTEENDQKHIDDLTGILHLIDAIQDDAVDSGEFSKDEVFAFTRAESGGLCERCGGCGVIMDGVGRLVPCPDECKSTGDTQEGGNNERDNHQV